MGEGMKRFRENAANLITISRILFAFLMLLFPIYSTMFWILYSLAGLSDIIDGTIARKLNQKSKLGAILDSLADLILFVILSIIILPTITFPLWLIVSISVIASIRIFSYFLSFIKFHSFVSLHTYLNKLSGLLLFLSPLMLYFFGLEPSGIILVVFTSLSSIEELIIDIVSKTSDRDIKSIFLSSSRE